MAAGLGCALKSVLDQNQPGDSHRRQRRKMTSKSNRFHRMRSVGAYLGLTTTRYGPELLAQRLGGKLQLLLAESLRVAQRAGRRGRRIWRGSPADTTVQPKDITFPTDAKLLHAAIKGLTRLARKRGVRLRQSYAQSSSEHNWSAAAERIWSFQSSDRKMIADHQSCTSLT